MPTSVLGSKFSSRFGGGLGSGRVRARAGVKRAAAGFSLLELLMVIAILAIGVGLVTLALPDGDARRLEEEAARLTALIEEARAESRVAGVTVRWVPMTEPGSSVQVSGQEQGQGQAQDQTPMQFAFVGLPRSLKLPQRWLHAGTQAEVPGGRFLLLGPEAILPPQRVVLSLGEQRLALVSDGLAPFAVAGTDAPALP